MEKTERIRQLERLGAMNQELVEGDDIIEEVTETEVPRELPLMLMLILGLSIFIALWIFIIYLGVGETTITTTLGNHFLK